MFCRSFRFYSFLLWQQQCSASTDFMEHSGQMPSPSNSLLPQAYMACRMGKRLSPRGVRLYSTLGGTMAYTLRAIKPSLSSSRNCWVSILGVASGTRRRSSLNRKILPDRCHRSNALYLPPISCSVAATGQLTLIVSFIWSFLSAKSKAIKILLCYEKIICLPCTSKFIYLYSIFLHTIYLNSAFLK